MFEEIPNEKVIILSKFTKSYLDYLKNEPYLYKILLRKRGPSNASSSIFNLQKSPRNLATSRVIISWDPYLSLPRSKNLISALINNVRT